MPTEMTERERTALMHQIREDARRRVRARVGLIWHVVVFVMANAAMYSINRTYSPNTLWFVWPLAGWGAGLVLHAIAALRTVGSVDDMVDAEVRREMQRRGLG
jgi:2TM domain